MADVKISDLTPATSANGAMQIEVNDGGTSKSLTIQKALASPFTQFGSTQNLSGQSTLTISSVPAHSEVIIHIENVTAPDVTGETDYAYDLLSIELSSDGVNYHSVNEDDLYNVRSNIITHIDENMLPVGLARVYLFLSNAVIGTSFLNAQYSTVTQPGFRTYSNGAVTYCPSTITHIRIKAEWYNSANVATPVVMTGGTVKVYMR